MLINQDFTQDRTKYLGGSDIGAILGLSKFKSPVDVWMEKTGKEVKKIDSLPLRFGSFAEEFVASEYVRATGLALLHDESILIHPQHSFMSAHIDRFILGDGKDCKPTRILECKTASPYTQHEWGQAGSDQIPMSYLCQCIWYMAITGIASADLAVLFGNSDFRIYGITRDQDLEEIVLQKATYFWEHYVLKDLPPPAQSEADYQTLFSKGNSQLRTEAKSELLEASKQLQKITHEIEMREQQISQIKQLIMDFMGESEVLTYQEQILATWKAPKPSFRLDAKRLEAEHAELIAGYKVAVHNSRRLIIKQI